MTPAGDTTQKTAKIPVFFIVDSRANLYLFVTIRPFWLIVSFLLCWGAEEKAPSIDVVVTGGMMSPVVWGDLGSMVNRHIAFMIDSPSHVFSPRLPPPPSRVRLQYAEGRGERNRQGNEVGQVGPEGAERARVRFQQRRRLVLPGEGSEIEYLASYSS